MLRAAIVALVLALPCAAQAVTPAEQIAALNAQREAHGIPAGIVERPQWTDACRAHMAYIAANGGVLTHDEQPGNPGFTEAGAMAGERSVLTHSEYAFGPGANAFESAPLHLMQTLAPALSQMGAWGGCATTGLGHDRTTTRPALFTYPGDAVTGVARHETAFEMPFVPGDLVGLPAGTTTGPHLLVMSLGTGFGRLTTATLSGEGGPLEVRTVDNETPRLAGFLPPGGMIIPVAPLAADASFTASATFQPSDGGSPLSRTWSFATGGVAPPPAAAATQATSVSARVVTHLRLSRPRPSGRSVAFTLSADRVLAGRRARISIVRYMRSCAGDGCRDRQVGSRITSASGPLASRQTITAPRPGIGRTIRVLVQTAAFEHGGVAYGAGSVSARWTAG